MNYLRKFVLIIGIFSLFACNAMEDPNLIQEKVINQDYEAYITDLKDVLARKIYQDLETFFLQLRQLHGKFAKGLLNSADKNLFLELQQLLGNWGIIVTQYVTEEGAYEQIRQNLDKFSLPDLMSIQRRFFPLIPKKIRKKQ